jgi:hypothetical protein
MIDGPNDIPVMGLEGALKSRDTVPYPDSWPPATEGNYPEFLKDLQSTINLQDDLLTDSPPQSTSPAVSPPLYGRWHAMQSRLDASDAGWVNDLNRDPRYRVPAGFGTQVIQTHQEDYVRRAWQQLGDVLMANQIIRQAQLGLAAGHRVFTRFLFPLSADNQLAVSQAVHRRVLDGDSTILQQVRQSRLPIAALSPAFRRLTRSRGRLMRRLASPTHTLPGDLLSRLNSGEVTAARPKPTPSGLITLEKFEQELPPFVGSLPPRCGFVVTRPDQDSLPEGLGEVCEPQSHEAENLGKALAHLQRRFRFTFPPPPPRNPLVVEDVAAQVVSAVNPVRVLPLRVRSVVAIPPGLTSLKPVVTIVPAMAHPIFADPMYKPLRDISSELLIPNLHLIPNNTLTLLQTNPKFIEAYMVGLNHEMARELLWREYPTDQRGSYFRQFWDVRDLVSRNGADAAAIEESRRDITTLDTWSKETALGEHPARTLPSGARDGEGQLVLAIRGDLLKKYPTAVIYAQKAKWVDDPDAPRKIRVLDETDPEQNRKDPDFKAEIDPDLHFLGFSLTSAQVEGDPTPPADDTDPADPGWFFVIQERPGEPRFGLDILEEPAADPPPPADWNGLAWDHLGDPEQITFIDVRAQIEPTTTEVDGQDVQWGANAADMAYILYQVPVMVAVHAANMLENLTDG